MMSTLVKTSGFPSLKSMMEDFWSADSFFNEGFLNRGGLPAVNVRNTKDKYELEVAAPGYKKDDFKITTEHGLLTISAETSDEKNEEKDNYSRHEFSRSSFTRTFSLPEDVKDGEVKAHYHDGLLTLDLKRSGKIADERKLISID